MRNINIIFAFIYFANLVLTSPIRNVEETAIEEPVIVNDDAYTVSAVEDCDSDDEIINANQIPSVTTMIMLFLMLKTVIQMMKLLTKMPQLLRKKRNLKLMKTRLQLKILITTT